MSKIKLNRLNFKFQHNIRVKIKISSLFYNAKRKEKRKKTNAPIMGNHVLILRSIRLYIIM